MHVVSPQMPFSTVSSKTGKSDGDGDGDGDGDEEVVLTTMEDVATFYGVDLAELMELNKKLVRDPKKDVKKGTVLELPFDKETGTPYLQRSGDHICNCVDDGKGGEWVTCQQCDGWCHIKCVAKIPYGKPHYKKSGAPAAPTANSAKRKKAKCKTLKDFETNASPWYVAHCLDCTAR